MSKNLIFIPLWKYFMRALSMIQPMGCIHVSDIHVSDTLNDAFRCRLSDRIQIVTWVSIVSCFMPFLEYRDNDSGLRPSSYPYILGRALNHYKIKPTVSICILIYNGLFYVKFSHLANAVLKNAIYPRFLALK